MKHCGFIFPDEIIEDAENTNSQSNSQQTSTSFSAMQSQEFE